MFKGHPKGLFIAFLNRIGKEPSTPRKIGFGMLITAVAFVILVLGSQGLASPKALEGRVAPPKYKGLMQGGWFAATAIGNNLVGVVGYFWLRVPLWALWSILVICCLLSAGFMFLVMKRLERAARA